MYPDELKARPGDSIRQKYDQLLGWIASSKMISRDVRVIVNQTDKGQFVSLRQPPPVIETPLRVREAGIGFYTLGEGYINGRLPFVLTAQGKVLPLVDADGLSPGPSKLPTTRPLLVIAEVTFSSTLSFETARITTKQPKELLKTGSANYVGSDKKKIVGHIPLAFLRKNRFFQFTLHNLQVRAYLNEGQPRVIYWPG